MEITTDITFKNKIWTKLATIIVDKYELLPNYVALFVLCAAIGVCDGKQLEMEKESSPEAKEINLPRAVLLQRIHNDNLDFLFQAYIFSSKEVDNVDDKIFIAFRDPEEKKMKKIEPLKLCANYGAKIIYDSISNFENEYGIMEELNGVLEEKASDPESLLDSFSEEALVGDDD